jgi:hypothetical protein
MRAMRHLALAIILAAATVQAEWSLKTPVTPDLKLPDTPGIHKAESRRSTFKEGAFYVVVPSRYSAARPMPLVVDSHGAGGAIVPSTPSGDPKTTRSSSTKAPYSPAAAKGLKA